MKVAKIAAIFGRVIIRAGDGQFGKVRAGQYFRFGILGAFRSFPPTGPR